jgi:protocatechuate 3,4-dioxygenase beta subunit
MCATLQYEKYAFTTKFFRGLRLTSTDPLPELAGKKIFYTNGGLMKRFLPVSIVMITILAAGLLAQNAGIDGIVTEAASNLPLTNAKIFALTFDETTGDSVMFEACTGKDGRYLIEQMPAGTYHVWCQHPDYFRSSVVRTQLADGDRSTIDFALQPRTADLRNHISGHVYSTPPLLPVFIPLAGAKVWLTGGNGTVFETFTGDDGKYIFKNIVPGIYTISAAARGHQPALNWEKIEVTSDLFIENLDINLIPLEPVTYHQLSGTVYDEETKLPLHPACITVVFDDPYLDSMRIQPEMMGISVINNEDGTYIIKNIPAGTFDVVCKARGYKTMVIPKVDFTKEDRILDFYLKPISPPYNNLLSGIIYDSNNGDTLPWVDLTLTNLDGPEIIYHTHSDETGYYQFHDIFAGTYQITALKRGYQPYRNKIELSDNSWITDFDIKLTPWPPSETVTLWGSVFSDGSDEIPVYPALIEVIGFNSAGDSLYYSGRTNTDGSYKIPGIVPGYYMLRCRARGYQTEIFYRIPLLEPEVRFDFRLTPLVQPVLGTITGKVIFDRSGAPVYKAQIHFMPLFNTDPQTLDDNAPIYRTYTNENGIYKAKLPPGKYIISCRYAYPNAPSIYLEYFDDVHTISEAKPVPVRENQVTDGIDFGIPDPVGLSEVVFTGKVTDETGQPLNRALVRVWELSLPIMGPALQGNVHSTYTDEHGDYKILINLNLDHTFAPFPVYAFIAAAVKEGYKIEFFEEKPSIYEADVFWAMSDTIYDDVNFTLAPLLQTNSISGSVTGILDLPLANAFVVGIPETGGELVFALTDQAGNFTLQSLEKTSYYLLFLARGYLPEFYDDVVLWEDATAVFADGAVTGIDANLSPFAHPVPGDSLHCMIAGRIMNRHGNPLQGALVMLRNREQEMIGYAMTDAAGYYQIDGIKDGLYELTITRVNFCSQSAEVEISGERSDVALYDFNLNESLTSIPGYDPVQNSLPGQLALLPNYPNPFNPSTKIDFTLPEALAVNLSIYDILGRRIKTLVEEALPPGRYSVTWNGSDTNNRPVSSGVYFYVLETPGRKLAGKLVLNR